MGYKAIGFDYGGVIKGPPGRLFDEKISSLLGVEVENYRASYFTHNKKQIDTEELWRLILADLNKAHFRHDLERLLDDMKHHKRLNKDVIKLVQLLRKSGYKVGLLSNNTREKADHLRSKGIDTYFDAFCVSAEIGFAKPEKGAFDLLCKKLKVKLPELIFIDDETESLATSKELGFTPILYESYDQLLKALRKFKIDV